MRTNWEARERGGKEDAAKGPDLIGRTAGTGDISSRK